MGAPLWRASPWVILWLTLRAGPFMAAPLWRESHWVSLWLTLGTVPFVIVPLWWASLWVSLWLTLGTGPFMGAPLWRASLWVSLWLALGTLPLKAVPLWRTSLWVSLWLTLGSMLLRAAALWRASQFQNHWNTSWGEYWGAIPWQSSPFLQGRAGNDCGRSEWVYRSVLIPAAQWLLEFAEKIVPVTRLVMSCGLHAVNTVRFRLRLYICADAAKVWQQLWIFPQVQGDGVK